MKVYLPQLSQIGDSICSLPFLKYFADRDGKVEFGPTMNSWVRDSLPTNFIFNSSLKAEESDICFGSNQAWSWCANNDPKFHMIDGYFRSCGIVDYIIEFPFPLITSDTKEGIVIAPFSSTNVLSDNRTWQWEKWEELVNILSEQYSITLIGTSADPIEWLPTKRNVHTVLDKPLSQISQLLINCQLFVSVDSGPSHLAHALGIKKHVLFNDHRCDIVCNPNAMQYKLQSGAEWDHVRDLPLSIVLETCYRALLVELTS